MKWTIHGPNLQAVTDDLPVSFWVSASTSGGFVACVYLGGKLIFYQPVSGQEHGQSVCQKWLKDFIEKLSSL